MTPEPVSEHAVGPNRLWIPVLLGPLGAGLSYFVCLQLIAPQHSYCERTAKTFPWWADAGLNVWGAVGLGLIAATAALAGLTARRSATNRVAWVAALAAGALAALTVTVAYFVPYFGSSCGE